MTDRMEEAKALAERFMEVMNGNDTNVAKAMLEVISKDHRTLQQNAMRCLYKVIRLYGESQEGFDARNEASVKWAKSVADAKEVYFPYI